MDLALLLFAVLLRQEVAGLKLQRLYVPAFTLRGSSALLECRYDLGTDKLYSITWYKDHEEFYRYVPKGEPMKHSYTVEGINVDKRQSNHQQVLLQDASLHTRGRYKCEVSAEAPNFNSVSAEANMEVVVLPQDGPTITGEEKIYATGDVLDLNCTSDKSHPAANLTWFINGEQVMPDSETVYEQHGLFAVISSLRLRLQSAHIADKINVSGGSRERRDLLHVPDGGERTAATAAAAGLESRTAGERTGPSLRRVARSTSPTTTEPEHLLDPRPNEVQPLTLTATAGAAGNGPRTPRRAYRCPSDDSRAYRSPDESVSSDTMIREIRLIC